METYVKSSGSYSATPKDYAERSIVIKQAMAYPVLNFLWISHTEANDERKMDIEKVVQCETKTESQFGYVSQ